MAIYQNGYCQSCWNVNYTLETKPDGLEVKACTTCHEETIVTEEDNLVLVEE